MDANESKPRGRLAALDGLRGYAAIAVVIYHAILFPVAAKANSMLATPAWTLDGYEFIARMTLAMFSGETAVIIFFVMSGAVLIKSLDSESNRGGTINAIIRFPLKRALRIYPALIACMIGLYFAYKFSHTLFPAIYPSPDTMAIMVNSTLFETNAHGASWTLKAEILAIPFILIAFVAKKYFGSYGLIALLAYSLLAVDIPSLSLGIWLLPGWLMYFTAGFLAYSLAKSKTLSELMSGYRWIGILLVVIFLRAYLAPISHIAMTIQLAGIIILVGYILGDGENRLTAHLSSKIPVFLGKISYSLYLWNVIVLNIILLPAVRHEWVVNNYVEAGIIIGIIATALSIPISMISEKFLERPFTNILRTKKTIKTSDAAFSNEEYSRAQG